MPHHSPLHPRIKKFIKKLSEEEVSSMLAEAAGREILALLPNCHVA
jgi:hypothetical protein